MIARYTRPEMGRIWSEENKFASGSKWSWPPRKRSPSWARFPPKPRSCCAAMPRSTSRAFSEIEAKVKHDVIAFTTAVAEKMAAAGRGRGLALAALRADVERRRRYRAGAAAQGRRPR